MIAGPTMHHKTAEARQEAYVAGLTSQTDALSVTFRGMGIVCEPGVAHPKIDSDLLALVAARLARGSVLETCAGSGAVGLSIASQATTLTLVDVSRPAVACAAANTTRLGFQNRTLIIEADLFPPHFEPYDLIIANPPYTSRSAITDVERIVWDEGHKLILRLLEALPTALAQGGRACITWPDFEDFALFESWCSTRRLEFVVAASVVDIEKPVFASIEKPVFASAGTDAKQPACYRVYVIRRSQLPA